MAEEAEKKYQNKNDFAPEEKTLVALRDELYYGRWDVMKQDLNERLTHRPYVFKLHNRIEKDLERISKLEAFERENNINLADLIKKEESSKS
jgi:hypothetical protein